MARVGSKVRGGMGAVLIGCALPGIALAGADPAESAAAPSAPPSVAAPPLAPLQAAAPQPYAQPPIYPAPAYGAPNTAPYGYPPAPGCPPGPGYPPSAYFTAQRLAVLDAEIANLQLRREGFPLTWPLTLLIGGGALTLVGIVMGGSAGCSTNGNQTNPNCVQDQGAVDLGTGLVLLGITGVGVGTLLLIIRKARRSHISQEIWARQLEAYALRRMQPRWGLAPTPNGGGTFSLGFNF